MIDRLKLALSRRQKSSIVDARRMPSAVLVPVLSKDGGYHILFTRRTEKVQYHKGEISFPGGAYEEKDGTLLQTALRECAEEIGLSPEAAAVLGELDDILTAGSGYIISPFVAEIPWPYPFRVDPREVGEIFTVPLAALLAGDGVSQETEVIDYHLVVMYSYQYQGKVIWGATARILNQFLGIVRQIMESPERTE
ncbi:NUDIX hydrolase [Chloroflexota bacterium]